MEESLFGRRSSHLNSIITVSGFKSKKVGLCIGTCKYTHLHSPLNIYLCLRRFTPLAVLQGYF